MKNKLSKKAQHKIKLAFWIIMIVSVVTFGALIALFRNTMENVNQDPSLATLTNDSAFKVVQIINTNKNLGDCWNQKNPYTPCDEIEPGNYTLHGGDDALWLEGPQTDIFNKEIFALEKKYVREVLGGFMLANQTYFQRIIVSYPDSPDTMHVNVETQDSNGQSYSQFLILHK